MTKKESHPLKTIEYVQKKGIPPLENCNFVNYKGISPLDNYRICTKHCQRPGVYILTFISILVFIKISTKTALNNQIQSSMEIYMYIVC